MKYTHYLAACMIATGNMASSAATPPAPAATSSPVSDDCTALPGYPEFRLELQHVVSTRNPAAFKALFHSSGVMRVNGIGGPASYPNWNFDRAEADGVWAELEAILQLGCARAGRKLLLPKVAALGGEMEPGELVVLRPVAIRNEPRHGAPALRQAKPGQRFTALDYDKPKGWIRIELRGRPAFLPATSLRSPHGLRLELVEDADGWRIRAFSDGV